MASNDISIWFFIGVLLTIYGAMILAYGIWELVTGNLANVCWPTCMRLSGGVRSCLCLGSSTLCAFVPAKSCDIFSLRSVVSQ
jgi:hypothetical protein